MGYDIHANSTIPTQIKLAYSTIVVPFENYVQRVKNAGGELPPDPAVYVDSPPATSTYPITPSAANSLPTPISQIPGMAARMESADSTNEKVRTASDKLNQVLGTGLSKFDCNFFKSFANDSIVSDLSPASKALLDELPGDVSDCFTSFVPFLC